MQTKTRSANNADDGSQLLHKGVVIASVVIALSVAIGGLFVIRFYNSDISTDSAHWGQLGDYLGGTINPLVGLATVILVLINIRIQQRELRLSLEQLQKSNAQSARQSFEQSLFAWLGNYRGLLGSIQAGDGKRGRSALLKWHGNFSFDENLSWWNISDEDRAKFKNTRASAINGNRDIEIIYKMFNQNLIEYQNIYRENRSDLDALFRTLYRLIHWIDNSTEMDVIQRRHYVSLVRAQLSWIELVFLLFNGLTEEGQKFAVLCNKYALFDNLTAGGDDMLAVICHDFVQQYPPPPEFNNAGHRPWPYDASAFASDKARAAHDTPEV